MIITHLNNIKIKLNEAAGGAVEVEMRMRLIGELDERVRIKIKELVIIDQQERIKKNPQAKKESDKYWECKLSFLDEAIDLIHGKDVDTAERKVLRDFRPYRNKLLHGNLIGLMRELGIIPTGRMILNIAGDRNVLKECDIKEAIVSIAVGRNKGLDIVRNLANQTIGILDKIIFTLPGGN